MPLLLALDPVRFPHKYCDLGVHVVHELVKRDPVPSVESKLDSRANMFGIINGLGALQDDRLKNDHPIGVPLPSSYAVKLHREG